MLAAFWADELTTEQAAALRPDRPDDLDRRPDVLVVGGGVIGLATAVACRLAGLGSVVVLERADRLASAASGSNGGAIAPDMHERTDPAEFVAFGRASLARYRDLDERWGGAIGLRRTRWLQLFPAGTLPPGPGVLDAGAIRELEPQLALPDGATGVLVPDQRAVNPQRLAAALAARAGTVATGVAAVDVRQRGERITAVRTSAGEFQPGVIVMATGLVPPPWSAGVRQQWVKGHMIATAPVPWRLSTVISSEWGGGATMPGGAVLCGGTFDPDDASPDVRPEVASALAAGLHRLVPATREARIAHAWCCFRPVVDGRHPVVDRLPGTSNGWVSAGHFTTGVCMAAATGDAIAAWIRDGTRPDGLSTFTFPGA